MRDNMKAKHYEDVLAALGGNAKKPFSADDAIEALLAVTVYIASYDPKWETVFGQGQIVNHLVNRLAEYAMEVGAPPMRFTTLVNLGPHHGTLQ